MDRQQQPRREPGLGERRWVRTIASLMMSAAVPWMTVLTASRSPLGADLVVAGPQLGDLAPAAQSVLT